MNTSELAIKVATEVMKWKIASDPLEEKGFWVDKVDDPESVSFDYYVDEFRPDRDISAAYQMEERIAELGLTDEYCAHLNQTANAHWNKKGYLLHRESQMWQLLHATPEDRCLAALAAVEEKNG